METGVFLLSRSLKMILLAQSKKYHQIKASISNDIPISLMKQVANYYCQKLTNILNECLKENRFPNSVNVAEINPVFKKLGNTSKENYWPIKTLSNFNKLFESIIYSQLNDYIEKKFLNTSLAFTRILTHKLHYYHKALHLGCCSSPRSTSVNGPKYLLGFHKDLY